MPDWYFEVNAGDIPNNILGAKGMNRVVWTYAIGGFVGFWIILALAIHTLYHIKKSKKIKNKDESNFGKVRIKFLYTEVCIQIMFMMACMGLTLGRCDAIIKGDFTEVGCYIGFYFEICVYGLGKCASYLLFAFRVKYAFKGSVFAVSCWLQYFLIFGTTVYMINNILAFLALPIEHTKWAWVHAGNVKMCVIPQDPAPLLTPLTLKAFPILDVLLCGALGIFFMYRLKAIRLMVIEMSAGRDNYKITITGQEKNGSNGSNEVVAAPAHTEMSGQTCTQQSSCSPTYISTPTPPISTAVTSIHVQTVPVPAPDKSFATDLHMLMWKQSILITITLVTTLCTTFWVVILPMLTNLLVYDCIVNAICNHLMFSFCNTFWDFVQSKVCSEEEILK